MDDLAFARADLDALRRFFGDHSDPSRTEWHITHNIFLPTEAARDAVTARLKEEGLFVSYVDTLDDDVRPYWLDMMEQVPPDVAEVERRIRRVLVVLAQHDGELNSFTVIGSGGETFPA